MILLRQLDVKDASLMLEWMHDVNVQKGFQKKMTSITMDQALRFCSESVIPETVRNGDNIHYAIVDENDEYMGTISIKNINLDNKTAEYAIVIRPKYQNHGIATQATHLLLKKAFNDYKLHKIYLTVLEGNKKAIKFYEKCGFIYEGTLRKHVLIDGQYCNWLYYGLLCEEFDESNYVLKEKCRIKSDIMVKNERSRSN